MVDHAPGEDHTFGGKLAAALDPHHERALLARHFDGPLPADLDAVAGELLPGQGAQRGGRGAVAGQEVVDLDRAGVSRGSGVEHQGLALGPA